MITFSRPAPIDFKPTPTGSPVSTPRTSPNPSPPSSRSASPSPGGLREPSTIFASGPPNTSTTTAPSTPPRPNSPMTRPWFAAFFKRRPSLDPYKSENGSTNSPAKVSLLNRLRAKTTLSPHRTLSPVSSPRRFFFQSDFDSFREVDFKNSTQQQPQQQQQQSQTQTQQQQQPQHYIPSPKLSSRIETLFQAAQISSMQYPFRKPLPSLREEIEPFK